MHRISPSPLRQAQDRPNPALNYNASFLSNPPDLYSVFKAYGTVQAGLGGTSDLVASSEWRVGSRSGVVVWETIAFGPILCFNRAWPLNRNRVRQDWRSGLVVYGLVELRLSAYGRYGGVGVDSPLPRVQSKATATRKATETRNATRKRPWSIFRLSSNKPK